MKIYRNNVVVSMELEEFLEILEGELFDELLIMIMEMDENTDKIDDVLSEEHYPENITSVYYDVPEEEIDNIIDILTEALNADDFFVIPQEPLYSKKSFSKFDDEDAKVSRILERYKNVK